MTDFEKVAAYLLVLSVGMGLYPMRMIYELLDELSQADEEDPFFHLDIPDEIQKIFEGWSEKDEAAFLIYFGNECMKRLEE